ncbi:GNAT family N-acetyltransferase [Micromonospora sp. WMMA1363]|uniref:GNAT family N-acetyltransferase n=1 Tax=Micromonospora sp. WMMA1363 TaxID=3053985 RepID=UPI00259CE937|nr:GNAT family N-acetyltransferase [Micromonospora sp. WMMA1363]MDM4721075.1 GNAT family N-acetyltransferase [Micromonospora sp. WMMA1363]
MSLTVTPYDVSDPTAIDEAHRVVAATATDVPDFPVQTRDEFAAEAAHPMPGAVVSHALARLDGVPVGHLVLRFPQLDNTDNVSVELAVHPAHRRRGAGRALLAYAVEAARERGRKRMLGDTVLALPDGPDRPAAGGAFAAATGAHAALEDVRRRLDVAAVDQAALDELLAGARERAGGYRGVTWRGPVPEEYVADVARLESRMNTDAPLGDLKLEAEKVDAGRVRATEKVLAARGRRDYHYGAVHEATGRLVAWTMLDVNSYSPWHAWQQTTIVDPEHRGHRLGLLAKVENLRYTVESEPQVRAIDTWNAAVNEHMIRINEQLGFRPVDAWTNWQLTI